MTSTQPAICSDPRRRALQRERPLDQHLNVRCGGYSGVDAELHVDIRDQLAGRSRPQRIEPAHDLVGPRDDITRRVRRHPIDELFVLQPARQPSGDDVGGGRSIVVGAHRSRTESSLSASGDPMARRHAISKHGRSRLDHIPVCRKFPAGRVRAAWSTTSQATDYAITNEVTPIFVASSRHSFELVSAPTRSPCRCRAGGAVRPDSFRCCCNCPPTRGGRGHRRTTARCSRRNRYRCRSHGRWMCPR